MSTHVHRSLLPQRTSRFVKESIEGIENVQILGEPMLVHVCVESLELLNSSSGLLAIRRTSKWSLHPKPEWLCEAWKLLRRLVRSNQLWLLLQLGLLLFQASYCVDLLGDDSCCLSSLTGLILLEKLTEVYVNLVGSPFFCFLCLLDQLDTVELFELLQLPSTTRCRYKTRLIRYSAFSWLRIFANLFSLCNQLISSLGNQDSFNCWRFFWLFLSLSLSLLFVLCCNYSLYCWVLRDYVNFLADVSPVSVVHALWLLQSRFGLCLSLTSWIVASASAFVEFRNEFRNCKVHISFLKRLLLITHVVEVILVICIEDLWFGSLSK